MSSTALIISGGIEQAFEAGYCLEQARTLRCAQPQAAKAIDAFSIEDGSVTYSDGAKRLCDLHLRLGRSEWIALAGVSGSGKSTLFKGIAGLLPVEAASFERLGIPMVEKASLSKRIDGRVGMVFQNPDDQLFATTVLDDLVWGLEQRGVAAAVAKEKSIGLLERLRISHLSHRPLHRLSFGERKRVAFASVAICDPELLLVDEPTIGLDPVSADALIEWLEDYACEKEIAVIWATHDLVRLPKPISRLCLLKCGRLVFDGPLAVGLRSENLTKAGLLSVPMAEGMI